MDTLQFLACKFSEIGSDFSVLKIKGMVSFLFLPNSSSFDEIKAATILLSNVSCLG